MIDQQTVLLVMGRINPAVLRVSRVESYCSVDSLVTGTVHGIDLVVKGSDYSQVKVFYVILCPRFDAGSQSPLQ